jgi:hypothetical protein
VGGVTGACIFRADGEQIGRRSLAAANCKIFAEGIWLRHAIHSHCSTERPVGHSAVCCALHCLHQRSERHGAPHWLPSLRRITRVHGKRLRSHPAAPQVTTGARCSFVATTYRPARAAAWISAARPSPARNCVECFTVTAAFAEHLGSAQSTWRGTASTTALSVLNTPKRTVRSACVSLSLSCGCCAA